MPKKPVLIFLGLSLLIAIGISVFFTYKQVKTPIVELPDLVNMDLKSAKRTAKELGLKTTITYAPSAKPDESVTFQAPKAGTLVKKGSYIDLGVSSGQSDNSDSDVPTVELSRKEVEKKVIKPIVEEPQVITSAYGLSGDLPTSSISTSTVSITPKKTRGKICIDPGHQQRGDLSTEPIGPGSMTKKPKVTGGAVGVVTKKPEYALMLDISLKLKKYLEDNGFEVMLTRDKNDVNISNSQRAKMASGWKADLFLRLHADSNANSGVKGISTLYPTKNTWSANIFAKSYEWAQAIHNAVITATGRTNRGVVSRSELSGFNWSTVPVILVEMGFMSNAEEDRLLNSAQEQQKIIEAIGKTISSKFN